MKQRERAILPGISMVMSVRNEEHFIDECLEGILSQSRQPDELIIVDDGSTDSTRQRISLYSKQLPNLRLLRGPVSGLSAALNLGLHHTRYELVARQDGDDSSMPERLELQEAFMIKNPSHVLVGTNANFVDENGALLHERMERSRGRFVESDAAIQRQLIDRNPFFGGSVMFRRCAVVAMGGYQEELAYASDYDLWLRLAETSAVANLPERLYKFRFHEQSMWGSNEDVAVSFRERVRSDALSRRARMV